MSPLLSLLLVPTLAADAPAPPKAVEQTLAFLRATQREDGHWKTNNVTYEVGVTSLAGLAFLSAGHTPGRGPDGAVVTRAIRAVLKTQRPDGFFAPRYQTWVMYQQGLALLFLSEALAGADADLARELRPALEKGVAATLKAQSKAGGWRYTADPRDQDVSVTTGQLLGLKAAAAAGLTVPPEAIDKALAYVRSCQDEKTGSFGYQRKGGSQQWANTPGAGLVLLLWAGAKDPAVKTALEFLGRRPQLTTPYPFYTTRYLAEFTVLAGGEKPDALRTEVLAGLAKKQRQDGSWPGERLESIFGPAYSTAQVVLALTADQRRLRVFQPPRPKEGAGKGEKGPERP
jgi:hypothetical protein